MNALQPGTRESKARLPGSPKQRSQGKKKLTSPKSAKLYAKIAVGIYSPRFWKIQVQIFLKSRIWVTDP